MEKEVVRKSISFPIELERKIAERAKRKNRSFSAQVVWELTPKVLTHTKHYGVYDAQQVDALNAEGDVEIEEQE